MSDLSVAKAGLLGAAGGASVLAFAVAALWVASSVIEQLEARMERAGR